MSLVVLGAIAMAVGCSQHEPEDPAEAAYQAFRTSYIEADSRAEQIALLETFLTEHADHRAAGYYAVDLIAYYAGSLDQPAKAYEAVSAVMPGIQDPEARLYLAAELAPVAAEIGKPIDLAAYVEAVEDQGPLEFDQIQTVLAAASEVGDWDLAGAYTEEAFARATAEAYRADYPDREFTDEEVAERVQRRRATALTYSAWVQHNRGQSAEAIAAFEKAEAARVDNYVGVVDGPLDLYWARVLLAQGDFEGALERITREALFGDRDAALPVAEEAYAAINDGPDGFEEYLWSARERVAPVIDDFTLTDYAGEPRSLAELRQDKVLLLAFWFPT
jgi:tetratricopeptide (TPR) repeat protein